ncbi:MAG: CHASE domain-containing protein [Magnetococcales bacterium]|nr:CHASE domain-containing protein [Magnetococcales bacterium]
MRPERRARIEGALQHPVTGWLVLALSVLVTILAWHLSNLYVEQSAQDHFDFKVEEARRSILKRMREYEQVLRGGVGLLNASGEVTRREWRDYVATLQLDTDWPGIQGIGLSVIFPPEEREALIRRVRAEGFDDFEVHPAGERALYSAILYLEPFSGRNLRAFGYDMWSEPVRRAAMSQARDSGQPALSGRVTLVQEDGQDVQAGVLMYLPVYRAGMATGTVQDRRDALKGFVYAPFRMRDLMEGILGPGDPNLDFALFDGGEAVADNRLLATGSGEERSEHPEPRFVRDAPLELPGGRLWLARFSSRPVFERELASHQSLIVALVGVMVNLLLFGMFRSMSGQKERIQRQARRIALELNQAEFRYRLLLENLTDVVFQTDVHGCWSFLNPAWEQVSGFGVEESLGRSFLPHVHPDDQARSMEQFNKLMRGALSCFQEEYRGVHRNGSPIWVEVYAVVLSDENGEPLGCSGIIRDVTMRKEVDAVLVRAKEEAEAANRAKSEFLANMSHELRSPLNSLLILSKLLARDQNLTGEQLESLRVIHESGRDLLRMINDILDLSKVEAGRMELVADALPIVGFSQELLDPFRAIARDKGLTLELDLDLERGLPESFVTDGAKLKQIIANFLSNALKFTERGGVILRVRSVDGLPRQNGAQGNVLMFQVVDSGVGIPESKQELIFESFRQLDGTTSRKYGGSGLGLSISRKLAELLQGVIQVENRAEGGSVFSLFLPEMAQANPDTLQTWREGVLEPEFNQQQEFIFSPAMPVVEKSEAEGSLPVVPFLVNGVSPTLLVVDDDMRMAFSVASGLQRRVEHVLVAANGVKALQQMERHPEITAVLLDMRMPEMDGFETLRVIREEVRFQDVAVLAMTAMAMPGDAERCLQAGADGYLAKPATMDAIWDELAAVFERRRERVTC